METSQVSRFSAVLERGDRALGWTVAQVPFDPQAMWAEMIRLRVRGKINGFAFRTSLFPNPAGGHFLLVNQAMQQGAGVRLGASAEFALWCDLEPRPAELPDDLAVLLEQEPGLMAWYGGLSEYIRREIGKWCAAAASDGAKLRRAQITAERLLSTMEAEYELPPAIRQAFGARPRAAKGWLLLTPAQRRAELLGVFYYQTPEAREKRIGKLCDLSEKKLHTAI